MITNKDIRVESGKLFINGEANEIGADTSAIEGMINGINSRLNAGFNIIAWNYSLDALDIEGFSNRLIISKQYDKDIVSIILLVGENKVVIIDHDGGVKAADSITKTASGWHFGRYSGQGGSFYIIQI